MVKIIFEVLLVPNKQVFQIRVNYIINIKHEAKKKKKKCSAIYHFYLTPLGSSQLVILLQDYISCFDFKKSLDIDIFLETT